MGATRGGTVIGWKRRGKKFRAGMLKGLEMREVKGIAYGIWWHALEGNEQMHVHFFFFFGVGSVVS